MTADLAVTAALQSLASSFAELEAPATVIGGIGTLLARLHGETEP
jgi:hypothetical protein